ncbi:MAG: hypothetical protein H6841_06890 [Planctomycetes bacterium]|nr:hypothetical protein [Planctomycetota bacterium]MCB9935302.1 hypothetical protein [Planctomycetota bacterium]
MQKQISSLSVPCAPNRLVWLTLTLTLLAAPLIAQPPLPTDEPKPEDPTGATGLTREEVEQIIEDRLAEQREGYEQYLDEKVDQAVRRRFEDFAPIRSRRELFIEFSGGLTVKYRQAQKSAKGDQPDGGQRAPAGISLADAWLSLFAGYSDVVESELTIRYNGDYTLLDEEIIEIPRGVIVYNRPLGQFVPSGYFADSFLFGIDAHFWRQARASASMALGQRAFHQDEVAQIRYTARFLENFYVVGALSDGSLLGRGQVDDSNNYPLMQDDKTRYIRGLGDTREVSRYLQVEFGGGFIFDFNTASFLSSASHFDPGQWTAQNTNFFNVLAWGSIDRLSYNEISLVEGMQRVPFFGGTQDDPGKRIRKAKWRMGANLDFALRIGGGDLFLQGHFIHAEDGRFVRHAWGVDLRYTFELPRIPFFLRITPMFRYSELVTNNNDNPLDITDPFAHPLRVSSGAVAGFSLADAAGFAANRREFMLGVNFTLARNVTLGFEIIFNEEDFKQTRNVPNDIPNTFYMLRIAAEF